MRPVGHEFGTTTGRPRRCGWLDLVALNYAVRLSGITHLALTKLDVLTVCPLKVCTRYRAGRKVLDDFPLLQTDFHHADPIYEELPGWTEDIRDCEAWQDLPQAARDYVQYIADSTQTRVKFIAVGPGRDETIMLPRSIGRGGAVSTGVRLRAPRASGGRRRHLAGATHEALLVTVGRLVEARAGEVTMRPPMAPSLCSSKTN